RTGSPRSSSSRPCPSTARSTAISARRSMGRTIGDRRATDRRIFRETPPYWRLSGRAVVADGGIEAYPCRMRNGGFLLAAALLATVAPAWGMDADAPLRA